jgi:hypothetical protein
MGHEGLPVRLSCPLISPESPQNFLIKTPRACHIRPDRGPATATLLISQKTLRKLLLGRGAQAPCLITFLRQ